MVDQNMPTSVGVEGLYGLHSGRVSKMASLVPSHHWRLRDVPLAAVLFVWVAFAASVFFYFSDWFTARHEITVKPQNPQYPQLHNSSRENDNDRLYSGSIFIVPERGERCWELGLDNRTGKMWDKGFVNCYEAISRSVAAKKLEGISGERLRAIRKTFNLGGD